MDAIIKYPVVEPGSPMPSPTTDECEAGAMEQEHHPTEDLSAKQRFRRKRSTRHLAPVTAAVGVAEVPAATLALSSMRDPDYADEFTLHAPGVGTATAEAWARAMFGDAPDIGQRFIFQVLLRLRLAPVATRDTVAGFTIAEQTAEWVRLEAHSALLTCHLVIQTRKGQVSLATVMDYHRRRGRITWTFVSVVHRRLAPGLLREAAGRTLG